MGKTFRIHWGKVWFGIALGLVASVGMCPTATAAAAKPNVVIFFLDDSGWSDFRPFGNPPFPTPAFERMAKEGTRFTQFYVPQAICSASRASLMTGCYPGRVKVFGAIAPGARGLELNFKTIAEVLKPSGYATAIFGKWHLGDQPDTRPSARGFDEQCGLMYSNDMWPKHPDRSKGWKPLQFYENGQVSIEEVTEADQKQLTKWYTEHAVSFIGRHKEEPFLLYIPHSMPHVPIFCSAAFEGKSGAGLYGDVLMELDWSLGQILDSLDRAGVAGNTLVIFTSDNGPWSVYGNHAGTTPFREAKGTTFDGGVRSACMVRWPGHVPAGKVSEKAWCSVDLLPTVAKLAGAALPDNPIDGMDLFPLIADEEGAKNPHEFYGLSNGNDLQALLSGDGRWKLHVPHTYRHVEVFGADGMPGTYGQRNEPLALYDLQADPNETNNVIDAHPDIAKKLKKFAHEHQAEMYPQRGAK